MKCGDRRNYLSTSYKVSQVPLDSLDLKKDSDGFSTRVTKRTSRITGPTTQTKFYHHDPHGFSRRRHLRGPSKLKSGFQSQSQTRSKTEISDDIEKQNKNIRIRQRPGVAPWRPVDAEFPEKQEKSQRIPKFLRYYKYSVGGHKNKPNQDRILCNENIYIVCDGHGPEGGNVSSFVAQKLMNYSLINKQQSGLHEQTLQKAFEYANNELQDQIAIDAEVSGSTAILVQAINDTIYCASCGDCKAVMSRKSTAVELNTPHKPDRPRERERIFRMGGEIKRSGRGPYRIYNPERRYGVGGLAVSRGFGDNALKGWGLIFQPEIMQFQIDQECEFVVIGSDGFFQFFPSSEVVSFTAKLLRKNTLNIAQQLAQESIRRWQGFLQTDDISCIVVLL